MAESSNHDQCIAVNALDKPSARLKRRSYTEEKKIEVLDWYFSYGRNKYQMCKRFAIHSKTLAEWLRKPKSVLGRWVPVESHFGLTWKQNWCDNFKSSDRRGSKCVPGGLKRKGRNS